MDIPSNFKPNKKTQGNIKKTSDVDTITLSNLGEKVDINPKEIKDACAKAAREAYNLGETNDEETYREDMEEILTRLLKEKAQKKK